MTDPSEKPEPTRRRTSASAYFQNTILAGVLAAVPLTVTWFVLQFLFQITASIGRPAIEFVANRFVRPWSPGVAEVLLLPTVENILSVLFVLIGLFLLGFLARQVVGLQMANLLHRIVDRVPLANKIYGATRQFVDVLQTKPGNLQRVVLIDFPSPEMKAVGLVTRIMTDKDTGEELAAVFVPTTPNPTNGYLEVVPVSRLTVTTMSMDDAMSFVISGGAVGPNSIHYAKSAIDVRPRQP